METILQIYTGSWNAKPLRADDVIRRLREIATVLPAGKVIIGWNTDAAFYREVGAFLHASGLEMLLWLPVFAGVGDIAETDGALDLFGKPVIPPAAEAGEAFSFGCPSSAGNLRAAEDVYERFFAGCGFDGVFLDRIRSQSFVSGVSGVLSCGCARCRQALLRRGADPDAVRKAYGEKGGAFFDMESYPLSGRFVLKDPAAERFFAAKEAIIADAVGEICRHFRQKGLKVGLDLFAPLVSRFVGQSYPRITREADFIKPMLYRRTEVPAGIGYEYALARKNAPGAAGWPELPEGRALLESQLDAAAEVSCGKYPGIEINYDESLVRTDPDYIRESVSAVRERGLDGVVLCWNMMEAPDAHIAAAAAALDG